MTNSCVSQLLRYLYLITLAAALTSPLATAWPMGHDGLRCHFRLDHFKNSVQHGVLYPRYLPSAFGGYGYPTFAFYPPGFYYLATPLVLLIDDVATAVYLTMLMLFFIGGVGAYNMCREVSDRTTSTFCASMFLITPYVFVDLYVRNSLAELTALL